MYACMSQSMYACMSQSMHGFLAILLFREYKDETILVASSDSSVAFNLTD